MIFPPWVGKYVCLPFSQYNCYELLRKIYIEEFGITLPVIDRGSTFETRKIFKKELANFRHWKPIKEESERDVIILRVLGYPFHIGMVIKKGWMLHTESAVGESVFECYERSTWEHRVIGFRRHFTKG